MEPIFKLLQKEDESQLRESALSFFYNVADSIGTEFSVLVDKIT